MNQPLTESARNSLKKAAKILVFSGAGLSTEAGIPDFRSQTGLYSQSFHDLSPEFILSHRFYKTDPALFYEYLRSRLDCRDIRPDASYLLLAKLEKDGLVHSVITQNIDSLHLQAGSKNVIELHGSLDRFCCDRCGKDYDSDEMMQPQTPFICDCGGIIRPDVVLFDEGVPAIDAAWEAASEADLLLVLGTSLLVYPAAYLPSLFIEQKKPVIIINRDPTPYSQSQGVIEINDEIGVTLQQIFPDYFSKGRMKAEGG